MRRGGDMWVRREGTRQLRSMKNMASRLSIVAVICIISLFSMIGLTGPNRLQNFDVNELWLTAASGGWRPSSAPRSHWPPPANGYSSTKQYTDNIANSRIVLDFAHTTVEVFDAYVEGIEPERTALTSCLRDAAVTEFSEALSQHSWFTGFDIIDEPLVKDSLKQWVKETKQEQATVFIADFGAVIKCCSVMY